jgi:hypothetical protein
MRRRQRDYQHSFTRTQLGPQSDGKIFLIVVEGEQTERLYFYGLRDRLELKAADVFVEHSGATDPQNIVDRAVAKRDQRIAESAKSILLAPYDEVWVVFDREAPNHVRGKQMQAALASAESAGLSVAVSNPSFEFWLLIHYCFTTKPFNTTRDVIRALRKHNEHYEKNDVALEELFSRLPVAVKNAFSCPRLNFEVQHRVLGKEAFIGCFVSMSFAWSVVEVFGDFVTGVLGQARHALALG